MNRFCGIGISDIGLYREDNQDVVLADDELGLYGVFDGLGGHTGGEIAARIASTAFVEMINASCDAASPDENPDGRAQLMRLAGYTANSRIRQAASSDVCLAGMGTTATVMWTARQTATFCHVGDSRAYLIRKGQVIQLTEDHTLAAEMIREGLRMDNRGLQKNFSRLLTRTLGPGEFVEPSIFRCAILPEDRYLLCTDGVAQFLDLTTDHFLSNARENREIARFLVDHAKQHGGRDNASVVVVSGSVHHD